MKYQKNQYTEGLTFCGLVIAGAFIAWGIWSLIGFDWWGIILLVLGLGCLSSQIYKFSTRSKIRNIVKYEFEKNPKATIEDIQKATGFSKKDIQSIILDLKGTGELKGSFSSKTGELKDFQKIEEIKGKTCPNCGTIVKKPQAGYCNYCGAKLE